MHQINAHLLGEILAQQIIVLVPLTVLLASTEFAIFITDAGGFGNAIFSDVANDVAQAFAVLTYLTILVLAENRRELVMLMVIAMVAIAIQEYSGSGSWVAISTLASGGMLTIVPRPHKPGNGWLRLTFAAVFSLLLPLALLSSRVGQISTLSHFETYDIKAYLTDWKLGFSPSIVLGKLANSSEELHALLTIVYNRLIIVIATCYLLNVRARNRQPGVFLGASFLAGFLGFVLYHLFPAAGPLYAFGSAFPNARPQPSTLIAMPTLLNVAAPRNCAPSLHIAWVMLAAIESRRLGRGWSAGFSIFAVLTILATIGLGEHYIVDFFLTIPFTLAVHAACDMKRPNRGGTVLFGTAVTLGWMAFLRLWPIIPIICDAGWWALAPTTLLAAYQLGRVWLSGDAEESLADSLARTRPIWGFLESSFSRSVDPSARPSGAEE
jgi:hypothetical protein